MAFFVLLWFPLVPYGFLRVPLFSFVFLWFPLLSFVLRSGAGSQASRKLSFTMCLARLAQCRPPGGEVLQCV